MGRTTHAGWTLRLTRSADGATLIVGVFELGLRMAGTDPQWTYLLIGALIIGAVAIDQWIRKVSG